MTSLLRNINIIKGQKALGVSIWLRPDSEYEIHSVLVQTSKSKLHVEKKWSQSELNEFSSSFNHNVPVYLSLDGSGVLHKIVNSTDDNLLIESLLPGANIDDFIIQEVQLTGDKILVSIARREVVEAVTKKINDQGFYILKIFLGPLSITSVNELLESDQEISLPHYNISIIGKDINSIKKNETKQGVFSLSLESEEIEPDFVISFSNSLHHFTSCNRIKLNDDFTDIQSLNYRYKKLSQVVGSSVLILVFISLLINFFLFDYYHNKNLLAKNEVETNKELLSRIEDLKKRVQTTREYIISNPFETNRLFPYFSDRIVKEVPKGITLSRLTLFPLQKKLPTNDSYRFMKDKISISGYAASSEFIDYWIRSLKKYKWVKDIAIRSFSATDSELARFDLKIEISK